MSPIWKSWNLYNCSLSSQPVEDSSTRSITSSIIHHSLNSNYLKLYICTCMYNYIYLIYMYIIVFTCRRQKSKQQTPSSHPPCLHKLFWTNIFQFPCQHCHFERFDRANRFFLKPTVGGWNPMKPMKPSLVNTEKPIFWNRCWWDICDFLKKR